MAGISRARRYRSALLDATRYTSVGPLAYRQQLPLSSLLHALVPSLYCERYLHQPFFRRAAIEDSSGFGTWEADSVEVLEVAAKRRARDVQQAASTEATAAAKELVMERIHALQHEVQAAAEQRVDPWAVMPGPVVLPLTPARG